MGLSAIKCLANGHLRSSRTGGRAVECTGLENRQGCKPFVGSNPTLSAIFHWEIKISLEAFAMLPKWPHGVLLHLPPERASDPDLT